MARTPSDGTDSDARAPDGLPSAFIVRPETCDEATNRTIVLLAARLERVEARGAALAARVGGLEGALAAANVRLEEIEGRLNEMPRPRAESSFAPAISTGNPFLDWQDDDYFAGCNFDPTRAFG